MRAGVLLPLVFAASVNAFATETKATSTTNAEATQKKDESEKDIDEEITNASLRSQLGTKSKLSIKSSFGYSGGSIENPFDRIRPNYRAGHNRPALTALSGDVGMNYRLSERDSLSFGTGLSVLNPFHVDLTKSKFTDPRGSGKEVNHYQVSNPYVHYSRAYKTGGMQMISEVSYSHYTTESATSSEVGMNAFGGFSLEQTILLDIEESKWSGGMVFGFGATFYKGDLSSFMISKGARQGDFDYGIFPFIEHSFNDMFSFHTEFGYFEMAHYRDQVGENKSAMEGTYPYQSVGLGISLARDIHIYPNVQFLPLDIRSDLTNVAVSANVNLL